jgi:hypothetical protein
MKKILLEAPILTQSGYGEHSRLVFRSLMRSADLDVYVNPLNWGNTGWITTYDEERDQIEECIKKFSHYIEASKKNNQNMFFDKQVFVGILNEFEKRAEESICVTAGIETDIVSSSWLLTANNGIDKLIVPSHHAKSSFENTSYEISYKAEEDASVLKCLCPIDVVPYPVKQINPKDIDLKIETNFNFLSVALLGPRKNLENMMVWFCQEFKDEDVGLVIKTGISKGSVMDQHETSKYIKQVLRDIPKDRKCKIYLLHGDLTEQEIHSLYVREDIHCYITTTHGEGYGLPIFEAAYSGLPIIATNWSGHLDFLSGKYKEGKKIKTKKLFAKVDYELHEIHPSVVWEGVLQSDSKWAYPKEKSFKDQARKVFENYNMYKNWAESLKGQIMETHVSEKVETQMLSAIHPKATEEEAEWKLNLSKIETL